MSDANELIYEYEEQALSVFEADAVEYRILELQEKLKRERETHRRTREQLSSMMIERDRGKVRVKQFEDLTLRLSEDIDRQEAMKNEIISPETLAALRHCVYSDLLDRLPVASMGQLREFLTNLYLPAESVNPRFLMLKVSPDIAETNFRGLELPELMRQMIRKYGDRLDFIAGFYRDGGRRIQLNLPKGCALYGYRSELGFYNGILCQPLDTLDKYFLLSSAKYGGSKALRLTDADRAFFDAGIMTKRAA